MEVAVFHLGIENLVAAARGTAFKNLGEVQTMGIEIGSSLYLSDLMKMLPNINIAYSHLSTEVIRGTIKTSFQGIDEDVSIAGKELPYAPNHTLVMGLEHNFNNRFQY